jgi:hypothetical protein
MALLLFNAWKSFNCLDYVVSISEIDMDTQADSNLDSCDNSQDTLPHKQPWFKRWLMGFTEGGAVRMLRLIY